MKRLLCVVLAIFVLLSPFVPWGWTPVRADCFAEDTSSCTGDDGTGSTTVPPTGGTVTTYCGGL